MAGSPSYQYFVFVFVFALVFVFVFCGEVQLQDNGKGSAGTSYCCNLSLKKVENGQFPKVKTQLSAGDGERGKCKCNIHILLLAKMQILVENISLVSSRMSK